MQETQWIWMNGRFVPWSEATVHVMTHALHYGTSFFEGIRSYETATGPVVFRLRDHIARLAASARIYGIALPYSKDEITEACREALRRNGLGSAYIRPVAFIGYGDIGVTPKLPPDMKVVIATFPWGAYLGDGSHDQGVDVCVSSWRRLAPGTIPAGAKAGGNYLSGFLVGAEARSRGFAEGIALGTDGLISEGAAENLFIVKDEQLFTPPTSASVLAGITRDTVLTLAREAGLTVREQTLPREALYTADELFFTGTAAEITPIRSVDGVTTGRAAPGPVTRQLQELFFGLFSGTTPDRWDWLDPVSPSPAGEAPAPQPADESHDAHIAV